MNRTGFVVATVWIGAVTWHWTNGPLRPDCRFMVPEGLGFFGLSPAGELILWRGKNGPLEFWSIPDFRRVREAFTAADHIEAYYDPSCEEGDGRMLITRDGKVFLADLSTGQVLDELPGLDSAPKGDRTFRGDRLIWRDKETLNIYDLTSKRLLAQHPTQFPSLNVSRNFAITRTYLPQADGTHIRETHLIDLATGAMDPRLKPLGPIDHITISPNEKFAVITQASMNSICDLKSGTVLWKTSHLDCQYFFRFENEGEVLAADVKDVAGAVHVTRWRASDGSVLNPPPRQIAGAAIREPIGTSRFALDRTFEQKSTARLWIDSGERYVRDWLGWNARFGMGDSEWIGTLVDMETEKPIGVLTGGVVWIEALPDGRGIISAEIHNLEHGPFEVYLLPPSHKWGWLIRWALLPPASMALLSRWWRRKRCATAVSAV